MPITLGGSARRRVVERDAGTDGVAGSAHGSIVLGRAVGRDGGAVGVAGSAHGSTAVAGRRGCAAAPADVLGTAGRGDVTCGVDSAGAGAAGGFAFARAARAGGLFESNGGGSVGFLTWSEDGVESAGLAALAGGEIGSPLCARTRGAPTATRMTPAKMPDRRPVWRPKTRLRIIRPTWGRKIRRTPLASARCRR